MTKQRFKKKEYKERVQPSARRKLGMLEKHKDYVQRAQDHHKKQKELKALRRKAENRNPDEFRFEMENARLDPATGKWRKLPSKRELEDEEKHGKEEQRLLQTQDIAYLEMRRSVDLRKVEKLRAELHGLDEPVRGRHTLFVDDDEAERVQKADEPAAAVADMLGTAPELLETRTRPNLASIRGSSSVVVGGERSGVLPAATVQNRRKKYLEMEARSKRAEKLAELSRELEIQRELSAAKPGQARKIVGRSGKTAVIWRQERKT